MTTEQIQAWLDAYVEAWRSYDRGNVFSNLFDIEFGADGRCTRFTEWYVHHPKTG